MKRMAALMVGLALAAGAGSVGAEPVGNSTEEFSAMVKAEVVKWSDVVKKSGARVD